MVTVPDRVEFDVGQDLTLAGEREGGRLTLSLRKAGERGGSVWGLTDAVLRRLAEVPAEFDARAYPHDSRFTFLLGHTVHNQSVVLIAERQAGQLTWTLRKDAASQRDETDYIRDLSVDTLGRIGAIVAGRD